MDDDTEMANTEPIRPHLKQQNMESEELGELEAATAAKQNPVDETMTSPPPLVDDNNLIPQDNVDEMVTEDSAVPATANDVLLHVLQQDTVKNVVHVVSKDVKLQSVENDFVDNTQDTELHSHPSIEEEPSSIDLKCQSNDIIDHHNTQQQTPIQNGSAAANFEEEDATTNSTHGNIETTVAGGSNHLNSGAPPETTSNDNDDNMGEGATPKDVDSETDTCSDSEEFQDHVSTPRLDTINENNSNAYLEENKDAESKLVLVAMNKEQALTPKSDVGSLPDTKSSNNPFLLDPHATVGDESGTEEEQASFMKELETFFKERSMDFKPPKFYGEGLNLLKLWRAVIRLGGYEQVTSCKLWRQVGESFKPPKTCTTVSWTFRCFYEKALLEYEKHEMHGDELSPPDASLAAPSSIGNQAVGSQGLGSGRARRDAAARAMQGWHSQRLLGNGEVGDPIIKDKTSISTLKREKQLKSIGLLKRKPPSPVERAVKVARMKAIKPQLDTMVVDAGPPADWVKINVRRTKDCFEVYALVPGLLREEVRVQSDPVGRLVISGEPEQLDNPWGVTPFKKVVSLPSRIDPHQTSAVVTLHGQLFVRVPFEQSDL